MQPHKRMKRACALSVGGAGERPKHGGGTPAGPGAHADGRVCAVLGVVHLHKVVHDVRVEPPGLLPALVSEACGKDAKSQAPVTSESDRYSSSADGSIDMSVFGPNMPGSRDMPCFCAYNASRAARETDQGDAKVLAEVASLS